MQTRIQKWGNSLAVRIPRAFAEEARLDEGTPVDLGIHDGSLVIRRATIDTPTLEQLLDGVTDENLHGEVDTGPATEHRARTGHRWMTVNNPRCGSGLRLFLWRRPGSMGILVGRGGYVTR